MDVLAWGRSGVSAVCVRHCPSTPETRHCGRAMIRTRALDSPRARMEGLPVRRYHVASTVFILLAVAAGCGGEEIPRVAEVRSELRRLASDDSRALCVVFRARRAGAVTYEFYAGAFKYYEEARRHYNGWIEDLAYAIEEGSDPPTDSTEWEEGVYWSGVLGFSQTIGEAAVSTQQAPPPPPPPPQQIPYSASGPTADYGVFRLASYGSTRMVQASRAENYAKAGAVLIEAVAPQIQSYLEQRETADDETQKERADALRAVSWPAPNELDCG